MLSQTTCYKQACQTTFCAIAQVAPALLQALQQLLPLRRQLPGPVSQLSAMLDRGILKLAKSMIDLLSTHPWCAAMRGSPAAHLPVHHEHPLFDAAAMHSQAVSRARLHLP